MNSFDSASPLKAYSLFSGSKGNCFYVASDDTRLLFDCGMSAKATEEALNSIGTSLAEISAIFITHEHTDHTAGLSAIANKYKIPVHISEASAGALSCASKIEELAVKHPPVFSVKIGDLTVDSFVTPHDSVLCLGYRICADGCRCAIATDVGRITPEIMEMLSGCDGVVIECNHDREMLIRGNYPQHLKSRILSDNGHLSNDDCATAIAALSETGTNKFMLAHLSADNNSPLAAVEKVENALKDASAVGVRVVVAPPDCVARLM